MLNQNLPVAMWKQFFRLTATSKAVQKTVPSPQLFNKASLILSTLASDNPLMALNFFFVTIFNPLTVQIPTAFNFFKSAALTPYDWKMKYV